MWAPKLQLTLCQCCFHFTLRDCGAFKSVSYDLKNLSGRLFFLGVLVSLIEFSFRWLSSSHMTPFFIAHCL